MKELRPSPWPGVFLADGLADLNLALERAQPDMPEPQV